MDKTDLKAKRIKLIDGDEFDRFTGWRRVLFWQRGEGKRIKRKYNKRFRSKIRIALKQQKIHEWLVRTGAVTPARRPIRLVSDSLKLDGKPLSECLDEARGED